MADDAPTPEEAVPSFLHAFMWASAFGVIEEFRAGRFWSSGGLLVASLSFHLVGINWPKIKPRISPKLASALEDLASKRVYRWAIYAVIAIALLVSIGLGIYRHYYPPGAQSPSPVRTSTPATTEPSAQPSQTETSGSKAMNSQAKQEQQPVKSREHQEDSSAQALISITKGSNSNIISGTRFINIPKAEIKVSEESHGNVVKDTLVETTKDVPVGPYEEPLEFNGVSNEKLRAEVIDFANEMRRYESDFEAKQSVSWSAPQPQTVMPTKEEMHKQFKENLAHMEELDKNFKLYVSQHYVGRATEYRNVLLARLGKNGTSATEPHLFWSVPGEPYIDTHSVKATALYLEVLATFRCKTSHSRPVN